MDAVSTGAAVGTVQVWDGSSWGLVTASVSSHGLGVADAIELARTICRLPARLRVYAIEGRHFELGTEISREVEQAVQQVTREIAAEACPQPT